MARVTVGGRSYEVEVRGGAVVVDGQEYAVKVRDEGAHIAVNAGGVNYRVTLPPEGQRDSGMQVEVDYRPFIFEYEGRLSSGPAPRPTPARAASPGSPPSTRAGLKGAVAAQIAGKIIKVNVKAGDAVEQGAVLLTLEAMKMENEIKAPAAGTVKEVLVTAGQRVTEGEALVVVE